MTRKEEINIAAKNKYPYIKGLPQIPSHRAIFIEGAEWADKTMLDRAENYLRSKLEYRPILKEEYMQGEDYIRHRQEQSRLCDEFITAFRQAMKGGAE